MCERAEARLTGRTPKELWEFSKGCCSIEVSTEALYPGCVVFLMLMLHSEEEDKYLLLGQKHGQVLFLSEMESQEHIPKPLGSRARESGNTLAGNFRAFEVVTTLSCNNEAELLKRIGYTKAEAVLWPCLSGMHIRDKHTLQCLQPKKQPLCSFLGPGFESIMNKL